MHLPKITDITDFVIKAAWEMIREGKRDGRGGRKDKLGGSDRDTKKVFPELCWGQVSVADGYLWIPVHCGIRWWTGSGWDFSLQPAVGLEIKAAQWMEGSSWCVPAMPSGWMSFEKVSVKIKKVWLCSFNGNYFCPFSRPPTRFENTVKFVDISFVKGLKVPFKMKFEQKEI